MVVKSIKFVSQFKCPREEAWLKEDFTKPKKRNIISI